VWKLNASRERFRSRMGRQGAGSKQSLFGDRNEGNNWAQARLYLSTSGTCRGSDAELIAFGKSVRSLLEPRVVSAQPTAFETRKLQNGRMPGNTR
jgi:hypothetical protein